MYDLKISQSGTQSTALVGNRSDISSLHDGHLYYPEWLLALFLYLNNAISKTELKNTIVEISLFEGKAKPANIAEFRKTVLEIENNISQIANKQIERSAKKLAII